MSTFWATWHEIPYHINPIFYQIGGLKIHYYGIMYLVAVLIVYGLSLYRIKTERNLPLKTAEQLADGLLYALVGMLVGCRLGYVLFYNLSHYMNHPLEIFLPIQTINGQIQFVGYAGMSYHGGVIGILLSSWLYVRKWKLSLLRVADMLIPAVPLAYMFGRIGNFINGELFGRITTANIGMYFPLSPQHVLRHPSQLYEALGEGLLLFLILWPLRKKKFATGTLFALYLFGYGLIRFSIEFVREPDGVWEFLWFQLSTGQLLCMAMMLVSAGLWFWIKPRRSRQK